MAGIVKDQTAKDRAEATIRITSNGEVLYKKQRVQHLTQPQLLKAFFYLLDKYEEKVS